MQLQIKQTVKSEVKLAMQNHEKKLAQNKSKCNQAIQTKETVKKNEPFGTRSSMVKA